MGQVLTGGAGQNQLDKHLCWQVFQKKKVLLQSIKFVARVSVPSHCTQSILTNQSNVVVAGGQESMSNTHTINLRNGLKMGDGNIKIV